MAGNPARGQRETKVSHTIELSDQDFKTLLLCLGYASGAAFKQHDDRAAKSFLQLANAINRDHPNWTPYVIEPSFTCPHCKRTSYHPEDVKQSYCGNCHILWATE
jgi:hypothetical protein